MDARWETIWAALRRAVTNRYALLVAILVLTLLQLMFGMR